MQRDTYSLVRSGTIEVRRELESLKVAVQSLKGMVREGEMKLEREVHGHEQARRVMATLKV